MPWGVGDVPAELERDVVVVACAISVGVHAALVPSHFAEVPALGIAFAAAAATLALVAAAVSRGTGGWALVVAVLAFAGLIAGYALAVTTGLPVLHPDPEPVDGLGLATKLVEGAGLVAALQLVRHGRPAAAGTRPRTERSTT